MQQAVFFDRSRSQECVVSVFGACVFAFVLVIACLFVYVPQFARQHSCGER